MEEELGSLLASEGVSVREASASRFTRPRGCALGTSLVLLLLGFVGVWAHRSGPSALRSGALQKPSGASMLAEAPTELKPWDCNTGFPIQVRLDRRGSWDLDTLNVPAGKYERLASIPRNPNLIRLNACAT